MISAGILGRFWPCLFTILKMNNPHIIDLPSLRPQWRLFPLLLFIFSPLGARWGQLYSIGADYNAVLFLFSKKLTRSWQRKHAILSRICSVIFSDKCLSLVRSGTGWYKDFNERLKPYFNKESKMLWLRNPVWYEKSVMK